MNPETEPLEIFGIAEAQFFAFVLVLVRIGSLFTFAPVFSSALVPTPVKAAAALALSLSLSVLGIVGQVTVPSSTASVVLLVAQEIFIGLVVGFVAQLVFVAVQFGGQVIGFDMGLGIVSVLDPQTESQVSIISQFQFLLALVVFLAVGGDRMLIEVFVRNLQQLPPGQMVLTGPAIKVLVRLSGGIFVTGLQAAAPVIVSLFAANVILGVFARSVPQMNMLILGFPLKILVGFTILGLSLPHWSHVVLKGISDTFEALHGLASLLR